jgi:hypothetical protein
MAKTMRELSLLISGNSAKFNKTAAEVSQKTAAMSASTKKFSKDSSKSFKDASRDATSGLGDITSSMGGLSPAASGATGAISGLTAGIKKLFVALGPIGIVIAAIGAAVGALTAYFNRSVEGQQKFANIMAYISGISDALLDKLVDLGGWLVKLWEDPKAAMNDFAEIVKTQITNRITGLVDLTVAAWKTISAGARGVGLAIAGIFDSEKREASKAAFAEMREGMSDVGKAAVQAITGVENFGAKLSAAAGAIGERARENTALQERDNELTLKQIRNRTVLAKLENEISAARLISNDESRSLTEQIAAQERAMTLIAEKSAIEVEMAQEALAIQQERMALGHDTIQDLEKEADLQVALLGLEKSRDDESRSLLRRLNTLIARREKEAELVAKTGDAVDEALQKELLARRKIMEEIRVAGLSETQRLEEELRAKLDLYEWSESEIFKIKEYYQGKIAELLEENKELTFLDSLRESVARLSETLMSGANSFQEYASNLKSAIKDTIGALIAEGVAAMVSSALKSAAFAGPLAPIVAPALAAAAAGVARTAFNSLIPAFADGAYVTRPTYALIGERGPEWVINQSQMAGLLSSRGAQEVRISGRLVGRGKDLYGVVDSYEVLQNIG